MNAFLYLNERVLLFGSAIESTKICVKFGRIFLVSEAWQRRTQAVTCCNFTCLQGYPGVLNIISKVAQARFKVAAGKSVETKLLLARKYEIFLKV